MSTFRTTDKTQYIKFWQGIGHWCLELNNFTEICIHLYEIVNAEIYKNMK